MDSKMSDVESTLISLNNLEYSLPESLSVVVSKQHKSFPALKRSYTSEEKIDFILSAGQQYVDTNESFITFDVKYTGNLSNLVNNIDLDRQTQIRHIMDIFSMVRLSHASGTTLYEDDHFNMHWLHDQLMELDVNKGKELMALGRGHAINITDYANCASYTTIFEQKSITQPDFSYTTVDLRNDRKNNFLALSDQFLQSDIYYHKIFPSAIGAGTSVCIVSYTIPLYWFPCFRNDSNSLLPSMLINGARLELQTENRLRFLASRSRANANADPGTNYEIQNPQIHLQLIDLSSRIFAILLQESINNGLEWSFDNVYTVPQSNVQESFTIEATRALSRVKTCKAIPFASSALLTTTAAASFNADDPATHDYKAFRNVSFHTPDVPAFKFKKWRYILGSMSYPSNDVRMDLGSDGAKLNQTYIHAINAYGWHQSKMAPFVSLSDFEHGTAYQAVQSLERSSSLQQSGLSLSMDASLRFVAEMDGGGGGANRYAAGQASVFLFITYSTVIVVIGDKVIVKT